MKTEPTIERLQEVLNYDKDTGRFTWKIRKANHIHIGAVAGNLNLWTGYRSLMVDGTVYLEHRLAWKLVYGQLPTKALDHIDGNKANNAISNLREVSHAENLQNIHSAMKNNRCGMLGVSLDNRSGRYQARIRLSGVSKSLGNFADKHEAHAAYLKAKRELHPKGTL